MLVAPARFHNLQKPPVSSTLEKTSQISESLTLQTGFGGTLLGPPPPNLPGELFGALDTKKSSSFSFGQKGTGAGGSRSESVSTGTSPNVFGNPASGNESVVQGSAFGGNGSSSNHQGFGSSPSPFGSSTSSTVTKDKNPQFEATKAPNTKGYTWG